MHIYELFFHWWLIAWDDCIFQVLLQFGNSRKILDIFANNTMNGIVSEVKRIFSRRPTSDLLLQEYDEDWNDWLDVEEVANIKDRAKLRVNVGVGESAVKENHAVRFLCQNVIKFIYIYL